MQHPYSIDAIEFKLGLEVGVTEPSEVVAWADRIIEANDFDDDVANVSLAVHASRREMMDLLSPLIDPDPEQEWEPMRRIMARMHRALVNEPSRAHDFARFLEYSWIRHVYDVPTDMEFMAGIEDRFQLAKQGTYGTVEEVTRSLLYSLAGFKSYLSEERSHHSPEQRPGG